MNNVTSTTSKPKTNNTSSMIAGVTNASRETITSQTAKVIANKRQIMNNPTALQGLIECFQRLTKEEYKSGFWDKTEKGVRKFGSYMNLAFSQVGEIEYKGELESNSEMILLNTRKARLEARQLHQLFTCLLSSRPNEEVSLLNETCTELWELFTRKSFIESKLAYNEQSMADFASYAEYSNKLESLKLQIQSACKIFITQLEAALKKIARHGDTGFKQLLDRIKHNGVDEIINFLQVYACKVRYLTDKKYAAKLKDDLSKYIVARSIGVLSAQLVIAAKYGKVIANILSNSFLGDIQSSNNNLSRYFMETLYFLLDDGTGKFSLECLCVGTKDESSMAKSKLGVKSFGTIIKIDECSGAYNLLESRKDVVSDIVDYYHDLSNIKIGNNSKNLIDFGHLEQEMLIWNLLGGTNPRLGKKNGLLFRIDEQLRDFSEPRQDERIYSVHNIFHNQNHKEIFMESLALNAKKSKSTRQIKISNTFKLILYKEKFQLTEIAKYVISSIDSVAGNIKKLNHLRQEYESILEQANVNDKNKLIAYFQSLINTASDPKRFIKFIRYTNSDLANYKSKHLTPQIVKIELPKQQASQNLIHNFLTAQEDKNSNLHNRKFELKFGCNDSIVQEHISEYMIKLQELEKQIEKSELFKAIKTIFSDLEKLDQFIMFCDEINSGTAQIDEAMTRIAPIQHLILMTENAVDVSRNAVKRLYAYYMELKQKVESTRNEQDRYANDGDIIQYAMLEILFDFAKNNIKHDSTPIRRFINAYDKMIGKSSQDKPIDFTSFELLNAEYLAIPEDLLSIYLSREVINYFSQANIYIKSDEFNNKNRIDKNTLFKSWGKAGHKVPNREYVLLHQSENALLIRIIDKIKDDLGRFTYMNSSIRVLESSNKFRLINIARIQFDIVKNLMLISSQDGSLTDSQIVFCNAIDRCIKVINNPQLDIKAAKTIFDKISNCFELILKDNLVDIEEKIDSIELKLTYSDRKNIAILYKRLNNEDFSVSLSKVPIVYSAVFQGKSSVAKSFRIMGAFYTLGVLEQLAIDPQTTTTSAYVELFENLASLQSFDLMSLVTTNYLHNELMSSFSVMSKAVGPAAEKLSSSIHLIQKLLMTLVSNEPIDLSSTYLDENEKIILTKLLGQYKDKLIIANPKVDTEIKGSSIQIKVTNGVVTLDLQSLITQIKISLAGADENYEEDDGFIELFDYVKSSAKISEDLTDLKLSWQSQEKDFTDSLTEIAKKLEKIEKNTTSEINLSFIKSEDIDNLINLACFFNTGDGTVEYGIITYNLSSDAVAKFRDLFNLCFKTVSKDIANTRGITYGVLFAIRGVLEQAINNLNDENSLKNYQFRLFIPVYNLPRPDEEIANLVKLHLKQYPDNSMERHLETLLDKLKEDGCLDILYATNAVKYYLNIYQYHKLSERLSQFYTAHYINLKTVEQYYNKAISYIIEISQENERAREISTGANLQFRENISKLNTSYKAYRKNSSNVLSTHINAYGTISPVYQLLSRTKMCLSPEQQKYNVKTHEWLIKMFDINDILEQLNKNDVPHMRTMLFISGIFDYLEVFYPTLSKNDDFKILYEQLLELYAQPKSEKVSDKTNLEDINTRLSSLTEKLEDTKDVIKDGILAFFSTLFESSSEKHLTPKVLKAKVKENIDKLLLPLWVSIFQEMSNKLEQYNEDLKFAEKYVNGEIDKKDQINNLELLPTFNLALNTYCGNELNSMKNISAKDIYNKIAELIKANWKEFADLYMSDNQKCKNSFKEICQLSFISTAIKKYLKLNYANIIDNCNNDISKAFTLVLTFSSQLENLEDLGKLLSCNSDDRVLLVLFLSNSLHKDKFKDVIKYNLISNNFTKVIFTKDVFDFLDFYKELADYSTFSSILNERLSSYNLLNGPSYENFCTTYELEKQKAVVIDDYVLIEANKQYSTGEYFGQIDSKSGNRHGQGKMIFADKSIYEGNWQDDKRHGYGKIIFPDGSIYEGKWKDGNPYGQGKVTHLDKRIYEGKWQGIRHAQGKITFPDRSIYEGAWKNYRAYGQGKMTYSDGHTYTGEWKDGMRHGKGEMIYSDKRKYKGEWKDDKRHGQGIMTHVNGTTQNGEWNNGSYIS